MPTWPWRPRSCSHATTYRFELGTGGHDLAHGGEVFPDTLRWLWRDYPGVKSVQPGPDAVVGAWDVVDQRQWRGAPRRADHLSCRRRSRRDTRRRRGRRDRGHANRLRRRHPSLRVRRTAVAADAGARNSVRTMEAWLRGHRRRLGRRIEWPNRSCPGFLDHRSTKAQVRRTTEFRLSQPDEMRAESLGLGSSHLSADARVAAEDQPPKSGSETAPLATPSIMRIASTGSNSMPKPVVGKKQASEPTTPHACCRQQSRGSSRDRTRRRRPSPPRQDHHSAPGWPKRARAASIRPASRTPSVPPCSAI